MTAQETSQETLQAEARANNKAHWDTLAPLWKAWWHRFGPASQPVSDWLVAKAGLTPNTRVLDLATGMGEPALSFARALADLQAQEGEVLGIDQSEQMIKFAREQAAAEGLSRARFAVQDVEQLTLAEEAPFDVIVSRWGLMFCTDLPATLSRARQCLKPGLKSEGRLLASVWGQPQNVPMLDLAQVALKNSLGRELQRPGPGPFALADQALLTAQLSAGGFRLETLETVDVLLVCEDAQAYLSERAAMAPLLAEELAGLTVDERARYDEALEQAATPWRHNGRLELVNQALCLVAVPV